MKRIRLEMSTHRKRQQIYSYAIEINTCAAQTKNTTFYVLWRRRSKFSAISIFRSLKVKIFPYTVLYRFEYHAFQAFKEKKTNAKILLKIKVHKYIRKTKNTRKNYKQTIKFINNKTFGYRYLLSSNVIMLDLHNLIKQLKHN